MGHGEIQTNHKDGIKLKMQIHPKMCPCLLVKNQVAYGITKLGCCTQVTLL